MRLAEDRGVRLALLLMAVKPLRKVSRIEQVATGLRHMTDDEVYYWYSKCSDLETGQRAQRALRLLLSRD
jgi:hypothetical protein